MPQPETLTTKSFGAFEIKDAEKGEVEAVIATLGVIDRDKDIIRAGAIPDGSKVSLSSYGHEAMWGAAPVGKGELVTVGDKVVFKGRVFIGTDKGREAFALLKEMGPDQEWSFGFMVRGAESPTDAEYEKGARQVLTKLDAFEVSPVIRGAGIGTRTVSAKAADLEPNIELDSTVLETSTGWQPRTGNEKSSDDLARELRIRNARARFGL